MGLLLDIVPNHMAASPENQWWMDVLENGSASPYASYFGINWGAAEAANRIRSFCRSSASHTAAYLKRANSSSVMRQAGFSCQLLLRIGSQLAWSVTRAF